MLDRSPASAGLPESPRAYRGLVDGACIEAADGGTYKIHGAGMLRLVTREPIGGFKQSGIGRAAGMYGVEEYTEIKTTHIELGERVRWVTD